MRKLFIALLIIVIGAIGTYIWTQTENGTAYGATGFLVREQISGMNKICYYSCLGGEVAITIKSTQLCPLSINCD